MGWHGYLQDGGAGAEKLNEKVLKNTWYLKLNHTLQAIVKIQLDDST